MWMTPVGDSITRARSSRPAGTSSSRRRAGAEQHRREVDAAARRAARRASALLDRAAAAVDLDVLARPRPRAPARARTRTPSVTKWNVVPPSISSGSRAWWVSTKTLWWNGGSSPHQPRAVRVVLPRAGAAAVHLAAHDPGAGARDRLRSISVGVDARPRRPRGRAPRCHAIAANAHSCSCIPPMPSGSSMRRVGARDEAVEGDGEIGDQFAHGALRPRARAGFIAA